MNKRSLIAILIGFCLFMLINCGGNPVIPDPPDPPPPPPTQNSLQVTNMNPPIGSTLKIGTNITIWVKYENKVAPIVIDAFLYTDIDVSAPGRAGSGSVINEVGSGTKTALTRIERGTKTITTKFIKLQMRDPGSATTYYSTDYISAVYHWAP